MSHRQIAFILYTHICINFFTLISTIHGYNENNSSYYILPAYGIASRADLLNSTRCGMELHNFRDAIDKRILWSLRSKILNIARLILYNIVFFFLEFLYCFVISCLY